MFKLIKDCLTDEYGKDFDLTNIATVVGYFNAMILYNLHLLFNIAPTFSLKDFALGYGGLIAVIVSCQKLKPRPIVPDISKEG